MTISETLKLKIKPQIPRAGFHLVSNLASKNQARSCSRRISMSAIGHALQHGKGKG